MRSNTSEISSCLNKQNTTKVEDIINTEEQSPTASNSDKQEAIKAKAFASFNVKPLTIIDEDDQPVVADPEKRKDSWEQIKDMEEQDRPESPDLLIDK